MVVFDLIYSGYDSESHYYFVPPPGTTQEDFQILCEDLVPQAGYRAVLKASHAEKSKAYAWITWREVVEALIPLLEAQGYQRCVLPDYHLRGTGIIGVFSDEWEDRLGFAARPIIEHNRQVEERLSKEIGSKKTRKISRLKKKITQIMK